MALPSATPSCDDESPKRRRVDDDHSAGIPTPTRPSDSERPLPHRQTLRGRAADSNAADHTLFAKHRVLVFNFGEGWSWGPEAKGKRSTSNMINHMRGKHSSIWNAAVQADAVASGRTQAEPINEAAPSAADSLPGPSELAFNIDKFYRLLCRWIVTSHQPFSEVENQEFQELLTYLKPALEGHLRQSQAIRDRVFHHAEVLRSSTKQYLTSLTGLMAIACDAWTSSNRIAFLAITGSWITHDWRLEETLLDFVELRSTHDGLSMANAVASALSELGIEEKVVALVSDNASNNGTLIEHLSTMLEKSAPASRWDRDK
ncbi:hypothetical protein FRC08_018078, partial [Ceratobasidium sp. 394]